MEKTIRFLIVLPLLFGLALPAAGIALQQQALQAAQAAGPAPQAASADTAPRRVLITRRTQPLAIDGRLGEAAWRAAPVITGFTQLQPNEGQPASEQTQVRVLFDDDALYVFADLSDTAPDSIMARLGRRDADLEADHFVIFIDPYHDRRSGYYFGLNAAGTLYDGVLMNDEWDDETWDGVWEGKVQRTDTGWSAEMRIPYTQLRFYKQDTYTWGVNFRRGIARKGEEAYLVHVPRNESGFVSRFLDMEGIQNIQPRRQMEVVPYSTLRAEYTNPADGNPFNDGSRYVPSLGADFKMGLTSNLTLNGTINPDFGQVEVDPAVVNLGDVETFFPEKRPFFIEGATVFDSFGRGGANNNWGFNWGNPDFFYSRRIGRAPQGSLPGADFAEQQEATRILGATKLTGRIGEGWNVGTIQALTERGVADYELDGLRHSTEVEPLAYYGVVRAQKEFNEGRQALGFVSTLTARDFREDRLRDEINDRAFTGGVDGWTFLDRNKTWVFTGWLGLTHVNGTQERMRRLQQSPLHYFQRPDLDAVSVDTTATSLTGMAGRFVINKQRGNFTVNSALGFISPGFDINDVGFMWQTNVINAHVGVSYAWNKPTAVYRRFRNNAAIFRSSDFDGNMIWGGFWTGNWMQFRDFSSVFLMVAVNPESVSNRRTRGGPLMLNPPGAEIGLEYESDSRKQWTVSVNSFSYFQQDQGNYGAGLGFTWQPRSNVSLEVNPRLNRNKNLAQWVGAYDDVLATATYGRRYVFAELNQTTFSSSVRLNWTFTPGMSLQLFAQPLISAGDYTSYKELAQPRSYDFINYGEGGSTFDAATLTADPDGAGPAPALQLPDQDFNFKSLRGTAVLRWEYRPGSTLFLVWTQQRSDFVDDGAFRFGPSLDRLFEAKPDNIFMIKLSYWLGR